jgi:hypothetical protein
MLPGDLTPRRTRDLRSAASALRLVLIGALCVAIGALALPALASAPAKKASSGLGSAKGWDGLGGLTLPGASWRPYGSTSPFNQLTAGDPVSKESAAIVSKVLTWGLPANLIAGGPPSEEWSHPSFFAEPRDPLYTIRLTEPWGRNPIKGKRIPIPPGARPAGGSDGQMTVVTPEGWEYDFWQAQAPSAHGGVFTAAWGGRTRIDGNGLHSGGTASGFGNLAGMIREPELAAGHIDHALFITLRCASRRSPSRFGVKAWISRYVYPASNGGSACPPSEWGAPPLGTRFMLAMSESQIRALPVPRWKKTILTALAQYGGYFGDTGGPGFGLMFESSVSYTALGLPDPFVEFARKNGVPSSDGRYVFDLSSGVEWAKYLRVLAPPQR